MVREEPGRLRGIDAPDPPVGQVRGDLVERPRRPAEALAGPPVDRVDVGVERPERRACHAGRARPEGRQDPVAGAGQGVPDRGRDAVPGRDERGPEARGPQRGQARPSGGELGEGQIPGPRGAELGRPAARPVRPREARGSGARSRAAGRGAPAGPRGWRPATVSSSQTGTTASASGAAWALASASRRSKAGPAAPASSSRHQNVAAPGVQRSSSAARRSHAALVPRVGHGPGGSLRAAPEPAAWHPAGAAGMLGGPVMSRLDFHIEQKIAQRDSIDLAARRLAGRPGWVVEFGLGRGRSYSHLAERFPDREIYCFDRELATNPGLGPAARARRGRRPRHGAGRPGGAGALPRPRDPGAPRPRLGRFDGHARSIAWSSTGRASWLLPGAWILSDRAVALEPAWGLAPVPAPDEVGYAHHFHRYERRPAP